MPVRDDFSAGGIATDPKGNLVVIATRNFRGDRVCGLPKGHPDPGEAPWAAALREVGEETGLMVSSLGEEPAGEIDYWFVHPSGDRVHKRVAYFRMSVESGATPQPDTEVDEVLLLPPGEAVGILTYETERRLVEDLLCG